MDTKPENDADEDENDADEDENDADEDIFQRVADAFFGEPVEIKEEEKTEDGLVQDFMRKRVADLEEIKKVWGKLSDKDTAEFNFLEWELVLGTHRVTKEEAEEWKRARKERRICIWVFLVPPILLEVVCFLALAFSFLDDYYAK